MIRDDLTAALADALRDAGVDVPADIGLERPARREHGDWSSNVAMVTAKQAGRNPRELATELVEAINSRPPAHVTAVEVAGPGFVNFRLGDGWLHDVLRDVVDHGVDGYACPDLGTGTRINVEFVSANPTGPAHAGHARGAVVGDVIARLLERCGYDVHREYYLNDRGNQMRLYADSLVARKAGREPADDGYKGSYVTEWAADLPDDADPLEWGYAKAKDHLQRSLAGLGVTFDTWFSERSLVGNGAIDAALADLRDRGVVYEAEGATWLRSSDFGDDKDRVLIRSNGELTYITPDIAYHRDKFQRGFDLLIDVWGADHHGYQRRLHAAIEALGHRPEDLELVITQMVRLERDGKEVRLSKRSGELLTVDDVVDMLGSDVVRFTYLLQSADSQQTIDLDVATAQSMENPVYYVQYAHARICSIRKKQDEEGIVRLPLEQADLSLLTSERELEILRTLSELPEVVAAAARDRAPHKLTTWLRELAAAFHGFYHDCYVIHPDVPTELTQARLWLVEAARIGLVIGLSLVGVRAPESM